MTTTELWSFLWRGYLLTVAVETPILLVGLRACHSLRHRLLAGLWLTACTYPIVILTMPALLLSDDARWPYLLVAEVFAPGAECLLFWLAFNRRTASPPAGARRDYVAIIVANLASFATGEVVGRLGMW
ncbi:MAG: hypothetical protein JSS27_17505 [Planctomycetes bacterium]|nr:hypothetical protein [Planctomycetota bacterium]